MLIPVLRAYGFPRTVVVLAAEFAASAVLLRRDLVALPEAARPGALLVCCGVIVLTAIEVPQVSAEHELLSIRGRRGARVFALFAALTSSVLVLALVDLTGGGPRQGVEILVALVVCATAATLVVGSDLRWIGVLGYALLVVVEPDSARLGRNLVPDPSALAVLTALAAGALVWCLTWAQRVGLRRRRAPCR